MKRLKTVKQAKQALIGLGFTLSFLCLLAVADGMSRPNLTPESRRDKLVAGLGLGLPAGAIATGLYLNLRRRERQRQAAQLRSAFFSLLQQQQGYADVLSYVRLTGLSAEAAKAYLDQRAKEFMAEYEVSPSGQIFYDFGHRDFQRLGQTGAPASGVRDAQPS